MKTAFWKADWFLGLVIAVAMLGFARMSGIIPCIERWSSHPGVQPPSTPPSDRLAAFEALTRAGNIPLGVIYEDNRATFEEQSSLPTAPIADELGSMGSKLEADEREADRTLMRISGELERAERETGVPAAAKTPRRSGDGRTSTNWSPFIRIKN